MREISFRAKSRKDGKWVYGDYHYSEEASACFITHGDGWRPTMYDPDSGPRTIRHEIDPKTLCQFVGINDRNGVKVFEGDNLKDPDKDGIDLRIEWRDCGFCVVRYGVTGALMQYGFDECAGGYGELDFEWLLDTDSSWMEVIGSVHD